MNLTEYFKSLNLQGRVHFFEVSTATIEEAAKAVGVDEKRIAKTLSFFIQREKPILIVTAGDAKIDNAKYKKLFGEKAKMIPRDLVKASIGYDVGGVCPFLVNEGVDIYLDESLKRFTTTFAAAGTAASAVELSANELELASGSTSWIDVCKIGDSN